MSFKPAPDNNDQHSNDMEASNSRPTRKERREIADKLIPANAARLTEHFQKITLRTCEDIFIIRVSALLTCGLTQKDTSMPLRE